MKSRTLGKAVAQCALLCCCVHITASCSAASHVEFSTDSKKTICAAIPKNDAGVMGSLLLALTDPGPDSEATIESVDFIETDNLVLEGSYVIDVGLENGGIGSWNLSTVDQLEAWQGREDAVGATFDAGTPEYFLVLLARPIDQNKPATGTGVVATYTSGSSRVRTTRHTDYRAIIVPRSPQACDKAMEEDW